MANGNGSRQNIVLERLEAQPEAPRGTVSPNDLLLIDQIQTNSQYLSRKVQVGNLPYPVGLTFSLFYGNSALVAAFSDDRAAAKAAAATAAGIQARRTEKAGQRLNLGSLLTIQTPAAAGYYWIWVLIPSSAVPGSLRFYDEDNNRNKYWVQGADVTISTLNDHQLWVMRRALKQGKSVEVIVKHFP